MKVVHGDSLILAKRVNNNMNSSLSRKYCCFAALLEFVCAAVLHDGVDINAKIPSAIPIIPGTDFENELFAINTNRERNETDRRSVIVTQNVTVRTPFLSVMYTNSSEIPKSAPAKDASILAQPLLSLPKASDMEEAVEHLNIPVRVAELVSLAAAESPAQFREKFYNSPLLEAILSDIEDKSKYYHEVTNLLKQPNTLLGDPSTKSKRVAKREAIFSLEQNIDGPTVMVMREPGQYALPQPDIDEIARFYNVSVDTIDDGVLEKASPSKEKEARLVLPHLLRLLTRPLRRPLPGSKVRIPLRRPVLVPRPPIIHPVIRPLVPPATILPIVRAFANPSVIRTLLDAIPRIPPIVAPRGDQIVHPPITSYSSPQYEPFPMYDDLKPAPSMYAYDEKPPSDSDFDVPHVEDRPLSPLIDSFSTLLQDVSVTR